MNKIQKQILRSILFLFSMGCALPGMAQTSSVDTCRSMDPETLNVRLSSYENALLIDTRNQDDFHSECIEGARLAENTEVLAEITDSLDRTTHVFIYCTDDYRSREACRILRENGFRNAYYLRGGMRAWKDAGLPTKESKPRTRF